MRSAAGVDERHDHGARIVEQPGQRLVDDAERQQRRIQHAVMPEDGHPRIDFMRYAADKRDQRDEQQRRTPAAGLEADQIGNR
jgi:hypothetical protein